MTVGCPTEGAIVGWTTCPPQEAPQTVTGQAFNGYGDDGRDWQLYSAPFTPPGPIWVKCWRIGYTASNDVQVAALTPR